MKSTIGLQFLSNLFLLTHLLQRCVETLAWSLTAASTGDAIRRSAPLHLVTPSSFSSQASAWHTTITLNRKGANLFDKHVHSLDQWEGATSTADAPALRPKSYGKGVWVPPSQNVSQRRGKVFIIQKPQDLLDFVIEDERLSVGQSLLLE